MFDLQKTPFLSAYSYILLLLFITVKDFIFPISSLLMCISMFDRKKKITAIT